MNNALEKVSESLEGKKINLIDELLSAEEISKMNFVENIILFETVLLSDEDLEKCIHKLNLLAGKEVKFLNVVLIYSSPEIMVSLISQCEKLSLDVAVSVIYSTNMLHNFREVLIKGGEVDSPYDQDVMKPDKIAQLFRKILTSNWDIVEQK